MKILVINCGSSSIKYQLLDMRSEEDYSLLAKGNLEKIALPDSKITHKPTGKSPVVKIQSVPDHTVGMQVVLAMLTDPKDGVISNFDEIDAVGHRIVQGADFFDGSVVVDEDVMEKIKICCDFAPLHNPAHILGIRAMQSVLPKVPQVVVFDTAFHQTMAPKNYMYALPYEYYEKYRVRRYGAHGTSHQYVSREGAKVAGLDINNSRIITCHIGNGSSVTAIKNGKVVDTSMGFTPLEGMIMGTRCGIIDANIVPYIMKKEGLTPDEMTDILNKKSGFIGLSGKSGSGKSTLLKLFMRFWETDRGTVSVSDVPVNRINTANLRKMESFVTQDTHLFHDSIRKNLLFARPDASEEEMIAAAKKASVHDFVINLPKGYDTPVGELGDTLSGGERQRLGLARAFLHDAPLMLLDEPTSNLDSLNEAVILRALKEEGEERTVLIVSHRASTMKIADTVYSIDSGRMS